MATWTSQVRLILRLLTFWCDAKKARFWGRPKSGQKKLRIGQKGAGDQIREQTHRLREKRAPCRGLKSKTLLNYSSLDPVWDLTRRWAQGPANFFVVCSDFQNIQQFRSMSFDPLHNQHMLNQPRYSMLRLHEISCPA